jgi:RNA polymerase sigma factor (sigma-70 family)
MFMNTRSGVLSDDHDDHTGIRHMQTSRDRALPASRPEPSSPTPGKVIPFRSLITPQIDVEATDAELLARCRRRDPEAWDILVTRYERLVYSVAVRNGLSSEDAADVTQATFVALIDSLERLREEDRLGSWLMTVARRQSWRVRNRARTQVDLDAVAETADEPLAEWDTVLALHGALSELGGTCKSLLEALYLDPEAPSYAEIAARMGRSIGGIGPLRGRCLEKLRAILTEDGAW